MLGRIIYVVFFISSLCDSDSDNDAAQVSEGI